MSLSSLSGREPSTRRRMRKGTHSCVECRQRKVRCITVANIPACEGCLMRNLRCIDQEHGISKAEVAKRKNKLQEKSVELQELISQILEKLPLDMDRPYVSKLELTVVDALQKLQSELILPNQSATITSDRESLEIQPNSQDKGLWNRHDGFDKLPLLSIIKDGILKQGSENKFDSDTGSKGSKQGIEKTSRMVAVLRAAVPEPNDLKLLLEVGQSVWRVWEKAFSEASDAILNGPEDCSVSNLHVYMSNVAESNNAVTIAKVLLCSALCVLQLQSTVDLSETRLPNSSKAVQEQYLAPVEEFLSQNENDACTFNGLHCMILQTRIYIIMGMPYRAWLIFRRALGYAHLLKIHREPLHSIAPFYCQQRALWLQLWHGERYLSLILGLPYSTAENLYDFKIDEDESFKNPNQEDLLAFLGTIAGKVIDRNQHPTASNFLVTMQIDQELDEWKNTLPKIWWETEPGPYMALPDIADMFVAKCTYHNIRKSLHLPFMLQSITDSRYQFNKLAALDASREIIKYYRIVRSIERPVLTACNLADFQVFTAAMVLVLNLLGQSSQISPIPASNIAESDWDIVLGVMYDLRRISKGKSHGVAIQAAQILEDLHRLQLNASDNGRRLYQAIIPYFGKLTIRVGNDLGGPGAQSMQNLKTKLPYPFNDDVFFNNIPGNQSISFDSYIPYGSQPQQQMLNEWNPVPDFNLCDDWSYFINTQEFA